MTSRERMQQIRAEQDAEEAIADEVRERIGEAGWCAILERNAHESIRRGETLCFYRDASGTARYTFRPATEGELEGRASDWVEDHI